MQRFELGADTEIAIPRDVDVELALPETPTSGYTWKIHGGAEIVLVDAGFAPASSAVGSGGCHLFRLRSAAVGRFVLEARLTRSWEPAAAPCHHVTRVTLIVR